MASGRDKLSFRLSIRHDDGDAQHCGGLFKNSRWLKLALVKVNRLAHQPGSKMPCEGVRQTALRDQLCAEQISAQEVKGHGSAYTGIVLAERAVLCGCVYGLKHAASCCAVMGAQIVAAHRAGSTAVDARGAP